MDPSTGAHVTAMATGKQTRSLVYDEVFELTSPVSLRLPEARAGQLAIRAASRSFLIRADLLV